MGVLGLWQILESVGHPIKIEGLEGKRLGVDANVWLYKFIRGFREKDNASSIDSHKLGLFNRVSKLLFYKIKPIFVFDGPAPVLKRRTLERRQNVRNKHLEKAQDVAMKLIAEQLKECYPDANMDNVRIPLPDLRSHNLVAAEKFTDDDRELFYLPPEIRELSDEEDNFDEDDKDDVLEIKPSLVKFENPVYHIDSDDEDVKPDLKPSVDIHSDDFAKLPAEVRYEILQDIKEERRRIRRSHALPEDAGSFSSLQLERLRNRRIIQQKIEECERDICSAWTGECNGQTVRSFRMQSDATSTMLYVQNKASKSGELNPFKSEPEPAQSTEKAESSSSSQQQQHQHSEFERPQLQTLLKWKQQQQQEEPLIRLELQRRLKGRLSSPKELPPKLQLSPKGEKSPEVRLSPEGDESPEVRLSPEGDESPEHDEPKVVLSPPPIPQQSPTRRQEDEQQQSSLETISPSPLPSPPQSQPDIQHQEVRLTPEKDEPTDCDESVVILSPELKESKKQPTTYDDSVVILSPQQSEQRPPIFDDSVIIISPEPEDLEQQQQLSPEIVAQNQEEKEEEEEKEKEKEQRLPKSDNTNSNQQATVPEQSNEGSQKQKERPQSQSVQWKSSNEPATAQASRTNKVTAKIVEEAKELLRLFGVPYIDAAGEAEAQCALLEELKLTEGTITDDSDVWLFGAQNVYRYFFSDDKYVMQYKMTDIEFHIRMTRENLVCFAMLVGSDYTDGIMNIGPVTALEVLSEFPGEHMEPLEKFKNWKVKYESSKDRIPGSKKREKLLKFRLPDEFPSRTVFDGYMRPVADASTEKFTWGTPELDELREYARRNFGWDIKKIDEKLLPVMKKLSERKTQPTIDTFFFKTAANQNPELFRSKRVNKALGKIAKIRGTEDAEVVLTEEEDNNDDDEVSSVYGKQQSKARGNKKTQQATKGRGSKTTKRAKKGPTKAPEAGAAASVNQIDEEPSTSASSSTTTTRKRRKLKGK